MPDPPLVNSDLQSALVEARQAYIDRNPKSFARQQEAVQAMPGGNTRTTLHNAPFPLTVVRGEGCRLWDADGHEYIDVLGEYTAGIYGHSHPVIRAAIDKALNHGWNYAGRNPHEAKLAQLIVDRMPSIDLVRFTNSGTEGNVMALAGARVFAQRKGRPKATKVMVFHGGYHGGVLYFVTGGSPVNMPYEYVVAPYNDIDGTKALLAKHGAEVFAVLVEPMQGSHGCLPGDPAFLKMLREETKAPRHHADLRRGHDLAPVARRPAEEARRHPRHDDARQVYRRRHVVRRLRRPARHHGAVRPDQARFAAPCRHLQQQRADHGGRRRGLWRGLHAGGGRRAERPRREDPRAAERDLPARPASPSSSPASAR